MRNSMGNFIGNFIGNFFTVRIGAAAALLGALSCSVQAQEHRIVGKWQWTHSDNQCTEIYEFKPGGQLQVVSGQEITENTYQISPQPDPHGFYTVTIKMQKTNRGRDCAGGTSDGPDDQADTSYIVFHHTDPQYMVCEKPALERCFGPFQRVK